MENCSKTLDKEHKWELIDQLQNDVVICKCLYCDYTLEFGVREYN